MTRSGSVGLTTENGSLFCVYAPKATGSSVSLQRSIVASVPRSCRTYSIGGPVILSSTASTNAPSALAGPGSASAIATVAAARAARIFRMSSSCGRGTSPRVRRAYHGSPERASGRRRTASHHRRRSRSAARGRRLDLRSVDLHHVRLRGLGGPRLRRPSARWGEAALEREGEGRGRVPRREGDPPVSRDRQTDLEAL